jgi:hypothetical protein
MGKKGKKSKRAAAGKNLDATTSKFHAQEHVIIRKNVP